MGVGVMSQELQRSVFMSSGTGSNLWRGSVVTVLVTLSGVDRRFLGTDRWS